METTRFQWVLSLLIPALFFLFLDPYISLAALFDQYTYLQGTEADDTQITIGTALQDFILQDGMGGNDTQYATGAALSDWLIQ